jgi:hypothetical protein
VSLCPAIHARDLECAFAHVLIICIMHGIYVRTRGCAAYRKFLHREHLRAARMLLGSGTQGQAMYFPLLLLQNTWPHLSCVVFGVYSVRCDALASKTPLTVLGKCVYACAYRILSFSRCVFTRACSSARTCIAPRRADTTERSVRSIRVSVFVGNEVLTPLQGCKKHDVICIHVFQTAVI